MNAKELGSQSAYAVDLRTPQQVTLGLTKRELFAAMAMKGHLIASSGMDYGGDDEEFPYEDAKKVAKAAAIYADALLAELSKDSK